jgi:hypothetical protein
MIAMIAPCAICFPKLEETLSTPRIVASKRSVYSFESWACSVRESSSVRIWKRVYFPSVAWPRP